MEATRCFLAVEISDQVRKATNKLIRKLSKTTDDVKWVEAENLHITTNFLGDVTDQYLVDISSATIELCSRYQPIDLEISGTGAFPDLSKPRTLWSQVSGGAEQLITLQEELTETLASIGFPPDTRKKYHAHLTLGRLKRVASDLTPLLECLHENQSTHLGEFTIRQISIFASRLERNGPKYTRIGRASLGE